MPDSIFLGSSLFALLTQNYPLGIFVLAMMEFGIVQRCFGSLFGIIQTNEQSPSSDLCIPGIPSPYQISAIGKLMAVTAFPSGPIFFISAVIMYTVVSILNFTSELAELGQKDPEWKSRIPICITFSILFFIDEAISFVEVRSAEALNPILNVFKSMKLINFFNEVISNKTNVYKIQFYSVEIIEKRTRNISGPVMEHEL
jgi:hypothetical protein